MELDTAALVGVLDRVGAVAFAISGVQAGVRRNFDIFGLWVMGLVTATGGGVMRDVILDRQPLVLARPDYLLWATGGAVFAMALAWRGRPYPRSVVAIAETGGLGAFAVAGALAAINTGQGWSGAVLMAILTATGGGVIRDLLADRVPLVLRSEVNATAAGLGGWRRGRPTTSRMERPRCLVFRWRRSSARRVWRSTCTCPGRGSQAGSGGLGDARFLFGKPERRIDMRTFGESRAPEYHPCHLV